MEELLELLKEIKPEIDYNVEKNMVEDELLDSFDIIEIVSALADTFGVEVSPKELLPENFASIEAIWEVVQNLKQKEKRKNYV